MVKFQAGKQHKRKTSTYWLFIFLLPAVIITVLGVVTAYWYQDNLKPLSDDDREIIVNINEGESLSDIAVKLEASNIIKSATAFNWYARLNSYRDSLQAGGYKLSPSSSVSTIVMKLANGDVATDLIVILPAQRVDQVKSAMMRIGYTRDEINEAFNLENYRAHPIYAFISQDGTLEGYLYPDSYQRSTNTPLEEIITRALDEMYEKLTPALIEQFTARGLSVHVAVTLASIIESEVPAGSGDRRTVSQVYQKRLKEGILLQADPTAQYGTLFATGSDDGWRNYDTPYNTYLYEGLPPGPISNVSVSSLEAVADPADTDYLFFVSGDDDETYFSRTFAEHEANIAEHCQIKCGSY